MAGGRRCHPSGAVFPVQVGVGCHCPVVSCSGGCWVEVSSLKPPRADLRTPCAQELLLPAARLPLGRLHIPPPPADMDQAEGSTQTTATPPRLSASLFSPP